MKDILSARHREVLERFARSKVLVALDFDGTLSPITERPEESTMRAETRALLLKLGRRYPLAVISGRAQADVRARMGRVQLFAVSGNHGMEPGRNLARYQKLARAWGAALRERLHGLQGVEIEDKTFSLALHYRRSREKRRARAAITAAVVELGPGVRALGGKQVLNVVPAGAPHKGEALRRLRREAGAETAIYVGDDVTDEDVFALDEPGGLLGVRVGRKRSSAASWFVHSQREIDALLRLLVEARPRR